MMVPSAHEVVSREDGLFESRPIPIPADLPKNYFLGNADGFKVHVGRLRAVALDICRCDADRQEAFRRLLAIEKCLWPNKLANTNTLANTEARNSEASEARKR